MDTNEQFPSMDTAREFSGTYYRIYEAAQSKGNNEFNNEDYKGALMYYFLASKAVYYGAYAESGYDTMYYKHCNLPLEETMVVCYDKLKKYRFADSLFDRVINEYNKLPDRQDTVLAGWYDDFAACVGNQLQHGLSTFLLGKALSLLQKDSIRNKVNILHTYYFLAQNYAALDSIDKAKLLLDKVLKELPGNDEFYCAAELYYGWCLYKLEKYHLSDSVENTALNCFRTIDSTTEAVAATYYALASVNSVLGKYTNAITNIKNAIRIASKGSHNAVINPEYIESLGFIDEQMADYTESEEQYMSLLSPLYSEDNFPGYNPITVKIEISRLYIIMGNFRNARAYSDEGIENMTNSINGGKMAYGQIINTLAYVRYCLGDYKAADTLYGNVIRICKKWGKVESSSMAIALNGLGLVATAAKKYKKADSLFNQSEILHLKIFGQNNPYTVLLYLNYGTLKTLEGDYVNAHKMLDNAFTIDAAFLEPTHDIFGDIDVAKGNLYLKQRNVKDARGSYEAALNIYRNKFGKDYYKVVSIEKLLKQL